MDADFRREARRFGIREGSHEWNMARMDFGERRFVEAMQRVRLSIQRSTARLENLGRDFR